MGEGSSSSVSNINSIARARHSDSRHQANTAARPGRHGNSSKHWAPSVGFSSTAPLSSNPTSMTPDCKRTGNAGNARKNISRNAAPYHDNSQAPEVFTVDDDSTLSTSQYLQCPDQNRARSRNLSARTRVRTQSVCTTMQPPLQETRQHTLPGTMELSSSSRCCCFSCNSD